MAVRINRFKTLLDVSEGRKLRRHHASTMTLVVFGDTEARTGELALFPDALAIKILHLARLGCRAIASWPAIWAFTTEPAH